MPPRKRQHAVDGGGGGTPSGKAARCGGSSAAVLVHGAERAMLPRQPTAGYTAAGQLLPGGRENACWAPPVVAIASFYHVTELPAASQSDRVWPAGAGGCAITVESVLGLRAGDDGEEACEVRLMDPGVVPVDLDVQHRLLLCLRPPAHCIRVSTVCG